MGGAPEAWGRAGFAVSEDQCAVGTVGIRLAGPAAGRGVLRWSLRDAASTDLDGLPTGASRRGVRPPAARHPNGVIAVDHLVAASPDLERTVDALREGGLELRLLREEPAPGGAPRQAFFRLGEALLEVLDAPPASRLAADRSAPARFWGIAFLVDDLAPAAEALGERLSPPRRAVQPGRLIATVKPEADLGTAVAFITPGPGP